MRRQLSPLLKELAFLSFEACEAYGAASRWLDRGDMADLFARLGAQRQAMAEDIAEAAGLTGDRDGDLTVLRRLSAKLTSTFAADRPRVLAEECERAETAVAWALAPATERMTGEWGSRMRGYYAEAVAALGQLAALRLRLRA